MSIVALNLLLAIAWTAVTGRFTVENFALGIAVGFVALAATRRVPGLPGYSRRVLRAVGLAWFVAVQLVMANLRVARDVLQPGSALRPAVIDVPLAARTNTEVTLLAALITLTPGSTALGISRNRRTMYVHLTSLRGSDVERAREEIKAGFERRLLEVLR